EIRAFGHSGASLKLVGLSFDWGRFHAHGVSLSRAAPTSVSDNGLSKLWFRKLLKFPARRLLYRAKSSMQSSSLIRRDHSSVSYSSVLKFGVETLRELTAVGTERRWRCALPQCRIRNRVVGGGGACGSNWGTCGVTGTP